MCHCFSARSGTRPTAAVRREFLVNVEISTKRGKLDYPILYADGKAPSQLAAEPLAPCFGLVDGSPPRHVPSTA
jgi:hypothetical protein